MDQQKFPLSSKMQQEVLRHNVYTHRLKVIKNYSDRNLNKNCMANRHNNISNERAPKSRSNFPNHLMEKLHKI